MEPGRSVVGRSGVTVYSVVTVKRQARTHVAVNGGMADNLEPMIYGQRFAPAILDRERAPETCDLVGHHCESGDILAPGAVLATPEVGDLLVMPATGAYCYSLLNNYNGTRKPPVVFARDGDARLAVRREDVPRPALQGRALTMTPHPLDPLGRRRDPRRGGDPPARPRRRRALALRVDRAARAVQGDRPRRTGRATRSCARPS